MRNTGRLKIVLGEDRKHEMKSNSLRNVNSRSVKDKSHYLTICLCQCEPVFNLFVWCFLLLQGLLTETMISVGQALALFSTAGRRV